jgi:hypothetical protein
VDDVSAEQYAADAALAHCTAAEDELTSGPVGPLRNTDYMAGLPTGMGHHTRFTEDGDPMEGCDAAGARRRPPRLRGVPPAFKAFHRTALALSSKAKCLSSLSSSITRTLLRTQCFRVAKSKQRPSTRARGG